MQRHTKCDTSVVIAAEKGPFTLDTASNQVTTTLQSANFKVQHQRRLPIGAEVTSDGGTHFRVWAPQCQTLEVALGADRGDNSGELIELTRDEKGYFAGHVEQAQAGDRYYYRLDHEELCPDPASRFQPEGPHGPSQIVNPQEFSWSDQDWKGCGSENQVVYEMHVGTFTQEGTWSAAIHELPYLAELGITVIEVLPVADFPGEFGWGYDGVNLFAPTRLYGSPDDFRHFVDRAHQLGIGVILDVVYNHLGPDGNYLSKFTEAYFTDRYENEWGKAINFDGPDSEPVREFFLSNVQYWIEEFHLDGYRLDATQQIYDSSSDHILAEITCRARATGENRTILLIAENEPQLDKLVRPLDESGYGIDALWNDDFHHSAMVAMTGRNDAYYSDYLGNPQEFISAAKWGYLYQGQWYSWQKQRRGTYCLDLPPQAFVHFTQNHDQIANSGSGKRCHELTGPGRFRTMTALLLLGPQTPMLFQGQEFAASSPFFYFADHNPELAALVGKGRGDFLKQFVNLATPEMQARLPNPSDRETFTQSKLDHREREENQWALELHRDLLQLRRSDPVFRQAQRGKIDGAVLGPETFVLRYFGNQGDDRLLFINFGRHLNLDPSPEPLLAPPRGKSWEVLWSSEAPVYGGEDIGPLETEDNWHVPGEAAIVMASQKRRTE